MYVSNVFQSYVANIKVDGKQVELSLCYRDTNVILLCFSVDSPDSLENIHKKWVREVKHFCPQCAHHLNGQQERPAQ